MASLNLRLLHEEKVVTMLKVILMLIYLAPGQPPSVSEYPTMSNGVVWTVEACAAAVTVKVAEAAGRTNDDGATYIAACRVEKIAGKDA